MSHEEEFSRSHLPCAEPGQLGPCSCGAASNRVKDTGAQAGGGEHREVGAWRSAWWGVRCIHTRWTHRDGISRKLAFQWHPDTASQNQPCEELGEEPSRKKEK